MICSCIYKLYSLIFPRPISFFMTREIESVEDKNKKMEAMMMHFWRCGTLLNQTHNNSINEFTAQFTASLKYRENVKSDFHNQVKRFNFEHGIP